MHLEGLLTLETLNAVTFVLSVIGFTLIFARQLYRLIWYVLARGWGKVPILLWTSIALSTALVVTLGGGLIGRVFNLVLRNEPLYVIPSDVLGIFAICLTAYVEWFVVEDPKR